MNSKTFLQKFKDCMDEKDLNKCKRCKSFGRFKSVSSFQMVCTWSFCKMKWTIFQNSVFEKFKKGKETLFLVINLLFEHVKLKTIASLTNFQYKNLKVFIKKLHSVTKKNFEQFLEPIGGKGIIVEIDESKFGKRKYERGHKVEGVWILGLVERTPQRKILLIPVKNRKKETLTDIIKRFVKPGSIIYSDCWKGYSEVKNFYQHFTVNHSRGFKNPENGVHTNTIEGNWSPLKQFISKRWRTKKKIFLPLALAMTQRNKTREDFIITLLNNE